MKKCFMLLVGLFLLSGCVSGRSVATPYKVMKANEYYKAEIDFFAKGDKKFLNGMLLTIDNKTDIEIEVVWDKTMYINNGQTSGRFMYEGVTYADRNSSKSNDIVFPAQSFKKSIFPNNLVFITDTAAMASVLGCGSVYGSQRQWCHNSFDKGEHGIYLTLKIGDKLYRETITSKIEWVEE